MILLSRRRFLERQTMLLFESALHARPGKTCCWLRLILLNFAESRLSGSFGDRLCDSPLELASASFGSRASFDICIEHYIYKLLSSSREANSARPRTLAF